MSSADDLQPPKRSGGDVAHTIIKAAASAIPLAGGPAAELVAFIFTPPLERRRDEWMSEIADAVRELKERTGASNEDLSSNDTFIDAALHATEIALRTSQAEKRAALRYAVLNSALPSAPEEAVQHFFFQLVDELNVWQLRLLALFEDPGRWLNQHGRTLNVSMGSLAHVIHSAYPGLAANREEYDQFWAGLHQRGLVTVDQLHTTMTSNGLLHARLTGLGQRFLRFIEAPAARV